MQRIDWAEPAAERWGFYGPSFYWARESECHLLLGHPVEAADAGALAQQRFNPAYLHNNAMALARRAQAQVQFGDVPAACRALAEAARMATLAGSVRLSTEMARAREQLRPYDGETDRAGAGRAAGHVPEAARRGRERDPDPELSGRGLIKAAIASGRSGKSASLEGRVAAICGFGGPRPDLRLPQGARRR